MKERSKKPLEKPFKLPKVKIPECLKKHIKRSGKVRKCLPDEWYEDGVHYMVFKSVKDIENGL